MTWIRTGPKKHYASPANSRRKAQSATDFHNAFFGIGGRFAELFPSRAEREAFAKTPEYQEIVRLRAALRQGEKTVS